MKQTISPSAHLRWLDQTTPSIAKQILSVSLSAYTVEAKRIQCDDFPPLKESLKTIQHSQNSFLGYWLKDTLVGVIEIHDTDHRRTIERLVVHPLYFNQGIGFSLVTAVTERFHGLCQVSTAKNNRPAIQLYQKLGFFWYSEHAISPPPLTLVTYQRRPHFSS